MQLNGGRRVRTDAVWRDGGVARISEWNRAGKQGEGVGVSEGFHGRPPQFSGETETYIAFLIPVAAIRSRRLVTVRPALYRLLGIEGFSIDDVICALFVG
jgi:hypothetical protein